MPTEIEFGSRDGANSFRDDVDDEYLTGRYDRRHKTVELSDDTPETIVEKGEVKANRGKAEREAGAGQVPLTDAEKSKIDFSKDGANIPHARSVKALFNYRGLDSWVDHYDPTLEVGEHSGIIERLKDTGAAGGGARLDEAAESTRERRAKLAEKGQGQQCDHARSACEEQHPEACEFLRESCGYSDDEIEEILGFVDERAALEDDDGEQQELVTVGGGEYAEMDVTPQQAGALKRSWRGYRGGIGTLRSALDEVRESVGHARRAMRAINAIRERNGRDPIEPEDLNDLLDALEGMPGSIPVVASLDEYVDESESEQPEIDEQQLRERAPERPERDVPERPEGLDDEPDDVVEFCEEFVRRYGIQWGPAKALCDRFDSHDDVLEATPALVGSTSGVGPATVETLAGGEVLDENRSIRWNRENDDVDETVTEQLAPDETPTVPADDGWQNTADGYKSRSGIVSVEMESEKPGNWDVVISTPTGESEVLIGGSMKIAEREMNQYVANNDPADAVALIEQNRGKNVTARDVVETRETPGEQGTLDVGSSEKPAADSGDDRPRLDADEPRERLRAGLERFDVDQWDGLRKWELNATQPAVTFKADTDELRRISVTQDSIKRNWMVSRTGAGEATWQKRSDDVVEALEMARDAVRRVSEGRPAFTRDYERVPGTGITVDRSGLDVPEMVAENIGKQLLEAENAEERQRVADENAARLERMGYDAGAASDALEYAEFVAGTDPGDPNLRTAIDDAYPRSSRRSSSSQQFANEQQGTLDVGVDSDEVAEEKQVTLTGRDEGDVDDTLPSAWREGNAPPATLGDPNLPSSYHAGPFSIRIDEPRDGEFTLRLAGGGNVHMIGQRLPSREVAQRIADEFTDRVKPNEISYSHSDPAVSEGSAAAKAQVLDEQDSGILNY